MAVIAGSEVVEVIKEALSKHYGKKLGDISVMLNGSTEGVSLSSVIFTAPETGMRKGRKPGAKIATSAPSAVFNPGEPVTPVDAAQVSDPVAAS